MTKVTELRTKEQAIQAARESLLLFVKGGNGDEQMLEKLYNLAYKAGEKAMQERAASYVEGLTVGGTPLTIVMGAIGDAIRALELTGEHK